MTSQSPLIPLLVTLLSLGRLSSGQSADHAEFRVWPGGSVTLPCLVLAGSINGTSFEWLKHSFAIAGTNTTTQNARVSTDKDYSLEIKNTTPQDSDIYTCVISDAEQRSEAPVRLTVATDLKQTPRLVTVYPGDSFTVSCREPLKTPLGPVRLYRSNAAGSETLVSAFMTKRGMENRPGARMTSGRDGEWIFNVKGVTAADDGDYICKKFRKMSVKEEEEIGQGEKTKLVVGNRFPVSSPLSPERSPIIITQDPHSVTGTEEGEVTVPCSVTGAPPGPVRWYRDTGSGRQYLYSTSPPPPNERNDPRVSQVHQNHATDLSIRIVRLTLRDSGIYYCEKYRGFDGSLIASGSGSSLSVREIPPPIITQDPDSVTGTEEGEVTVPCTLSTVGPAGPVRWYRGTDSGREYLYSTDPLPNEGNDPRVSTVHPDHPTDLSIQIVNLTVSDSGMYYCEKYRGFDGSLIAVGTGSSVRATPPRCHGYEKAWLPCVDGPSPSGKVILGESLSEFSVSLYRAVAHAQTSPRNLFFSPLSVAMALSHLLLGARGDAQTALEEALFLPQNFECLHKELRSLSSRNLLTASQIYVRPGLELQEFFKDQSKEFYGEGPQLLTNDSEANVRMVNEWVAEHTEHKITRLVDDVPATTELLLLNAIYYQGKWKVRFDVKETVKERFMSFGKHVEVPVMKSQGYKLSSLHHRGLQAKVGRFLLSGDTSLLVLLPTDPSLDSLLALESRLSSKLLADVVQQLSQATPHSTVVSLPKLRLDVQTDLAYILEKLGLSELFSSPNLCGLTPEAGVFVSDALHRAVLDLGESGVEAAGVTSVSLARSVFVFDALQPFMLVLWDDALRAPLFMGRVTDPSQPN